MKGDPQKKKHNGRGHDRQFKLAAVKLVEEQGYTPGQAAKSLGLHTNTLQYWIATMGQASATEQVQTLESLQARVKELERQNQRLVVEKEILKKATAFFAQEPT